MKCILNITRHDVKRRRFTSIRVPARKNPSCHGEFRRYCASVVSRGKCWARRLLHSWTELPTASGPKSAGVYCGYRPGPTGVTPPSRQDDGNVRAPALACLVCMPVQVVAVTRVWWWSFYHQLGVFCPHPSSTDSLCRGCRATSQTPPVSPYAMLHCCCCHPLGTDVALASGSALRGNFTHRDSWFTRPSNWVSSLWGRGDGRCN